MSALMHPGSTEGDSPSPSPSREDGIFVVPAEVDAGAAEVIDLTQPFDGPDARPLTTEERLRLLVDAVDPLRAVRRAVKDFRRAYEEDRLAAMHRQAYRAVNGTEAEKDYEIVSKDYSSAPTPENRWRAGRLDWIVHSPGVRVEKGQAMIRRGGELAEAIGLSIGIGRWVLGGHVYDVGQGARAQFSRVDSVHEEDAPRHEYVDFMRSVASPVKNHRLADLVDIAVLAQDVTAVFSDLSGREEDPTPSV